ncbi:MAG: dihydroneopterin aldolase [Acidimicrobiales bacterium]
MTGERIELRGLRVLGRCGATPEERAVLQPLEVDLDVVADLGPAGRSDRLADTIDYARACAAVADVASGGSVALLEHLAQRIADVVLSSDRRIEAVEVAVRKLRPPVPHDLASAGVRVARSR